MTSSGASGHGHRSNLAPQNMQWAIRSRDAARGAGVRLTGGSNLVFIDPSALRRSTPSSQAVAASVEPVTMATTASCLARAFGKNELDVGIVGIVDDGVCFRDCC